MSIVSRRSKVLCNSKEVIRHWQIIIILLYKGSSQLERISRKKADVTVTVEFC